MIKKEEILLLYKDRIDKIKAQKVRVDKKLKKVESTFAEMPDLYRIKGYENYLCNREKTFFFNSGTLNKLKVHTDKNGKKRVSLFIGFDSTLVRVDKIEIIE